MGGTKIVAVALFSVLLGGCSLKRYAIKEVGDALNSGASVFETDDDIEFIGEALPFSLKFVESLLEEVPDDPDLLITACRGYTLYSYAYIDFEAQRTIEEDFTAGRRMRGRARNFYLRAAQFCFRGMERFYPGFEPYLRRSPQEAAAIVSRHEDRDVEFLYWTGAALGLAISASKDDAAMLARLPEVEALLERALEIDPDWDNGALHEFMVTLAAAKPGRRERDEIDRHFRLAEGLSGNRSAGLYVAYAEAVAVPEQDAALFRSLLDRALAIDPDSAPDIRLANLIAQRRARWLLDRIGDLFLILDEPPVETGDSF